VFNGWLIVSAIIQDLINLQGLTNDANTQVLYWGSSAGGVGVMLTADGIHAKFLDKVGQFYALSDSGVFFETPKFNPTVTSRLEGVTLGWAWWTPTLEGAPSCKAALGNSPWNCSIANYGLTYIQTTTFAFSTFSDMNGVAFLGSHAPPQNAQQILFNQAYSNYARNAICQLPISGYFAMSGCTHTIAGSAGVFTAKINGTSVYDAIVDWFKGTNKLNHKLLDPITCYCNRSYDCNPTDISDPGLGFQYSPLVCTPSSVCPSNVFSFPQASSSNPSSFALSQTTPPQTNSSQTNPFSQTNPSSQVIPGSQTRSMGVSIRIHTSLTLLVLLVSWIA
jgi:hypothetical protein